MPGAPTMGSENRTAHPDTDWNTRPSSSSTHITVGMHSTPEEDLYAEAEAMQATMREALHQPKRKATPTATSNPTSPSTSPSRRAASNGVLHPSSSTTTTAAAAADKPQTSATHINGSDPPDTDHQSTTSPSEQQATPCSFDSDTSKYPASMTSSVRDHVYEGGLRYHAYRAGKYAFPNDEVEQNRDDMKHTMTLMLCHGAYFYAPVEDVLEEGAEVLDLGTGTGIWAMELGDRYPNTTITGIDLSPIQPNFVPENVHFFVDDFEEEWVDPENKYDYIHIRHTLHSVRDPKLLLERALRHLKPGGYFECAELLYSPQCDDDTLTPSTPYALRDWMNYVGAGMRVLGSDPHAILPLPEQMKAAGFADVQRTTHKCPVGVWPRDKRLRFCGLFLRTALMDGLRGTSRRPLLALGWTQLQIEMFLVDVRKALMDAGVHSYLALHVVHGRKPVS